MNMLESEHFETEWSDSNLADAPESMGWLQQSGGMTVKMEDEFGAPLTTSFEHINDLTEDELLNFISQGNSLRNSSDALKLMNNPNTASASSPLQQPNSQQLFLFQQQLQQQQQQQQQATQRPGSVMSVPSTTSINTMTEEATVKPTTKLLQQIQDITKQVAVKLEQLRWQQKGVSLPIQPDALFALDKEQKELKAAIEWCEKQLNSLLDTVILDSVEMHVLLQLQQEVFLEQKQLELYIQELQNFQKDNSLPSLSLVILSQPFPQSVKQHKSMDEPITVKLLTGAKSDIKPHCVVKAEVINLNTKSNKKNMITVENAEKPLNENGIAVFNDLKFPNGTRLKSVRLKFTTRISVPDSRGTMHTLLFETNPSNSVVVKTNENQWFEAEGNLLKKTAFDGQLEIAWTRLANWLQRRYLGATRQNVQAPVRPLTSHDFHYLHKFRFDSKPTITQSDFDKFWEWFGPLLHKIRYQRHICALWTKGYISGFLSREEVEPVLRNELVGTFLIRFSERCDKFAVSYQAADEFGRTKVKHYLIKADDIHGAKKTLPDFLRDYKDFLCILQLQTDRNDKRILRRCEKDSVLSEYYSKKQSNTGQNGYEETIEIKP